jgi:tRNA U34 5-carboxymethylaminomethyl modifying GTPase MnmE/TrmE
VVVADTAGLRQHTDDVVESIGVERARKSCVFLISFITVADFAFLAYRNRMYRFACYLYQK